MKWNRQLLFFLGGHPPLVTRVTLTVVMEQGSNLGKFGVSSTPAGLCAPGKALFLGVKGELVHINEVDPDHDYFMMALNDLYWVGEDPLSYMELHAVSSQHVEFLPVCSSAKAGMAWFPHRPPVWWQGVEEFAADA